MYMYSHFEKSIYANTLLHTSQTIQVTGPVKFLKGGEGGGSVTLRLLSIVLTVFRVSRVVLSRSVLAHTLAYTRDISRSLS